ncbi:MAG: FHA domain-containing protein [Zavarzinella sp.]
MPAQLLALADGPTIIVNKPILMLGRHSECDVQLNSRKISRRHCIIAQLKDHLIVRDLGSTNGVRINGKAVTEGKLVSGDELYIGSFRYQVQIDGILMSALISSRSGVPEMPKFTDSDLEEADEPIPLDEE